MHIPKPSGRVSTLSKDGEVAEDGLFFPSPITGGRPPVRVLCREVLAGAFLSCRETSSRSDQSVLISSLHKAMRSVCDRPTPRFHEALTKRFFFWGTQTSFEKTNGVFLPFGALSMRMMRSTQGDWSKFFTSRSTNCFPGPQIVGMTNVNLSPVSEPEVPLMFVPLSKTPE